MIIQNGRGKSAQIYTLSQDIATRDPLSIVLVSTFNPRRMALCPRLIRALFTDGEQWLCGKVHETF